MLEETPIRKPLIKKVEEPEMVKVETAPEPMKEEVKKPEPVKEAPKPVGPKLYRCKTKCWVKKQIWEVGDVTSFGPGEFVPEHFQEV